LGWRPLGRLGLRLSLWDSGAQDLSEPEPELLLLVEGVDFDPPDSAEAPPDSDFDPLESDFPADSAFDPLDSFVLESFPPPDSLAALDVLGPLADEVDERESLMYQPLPLNTMPTG
jgi:hypothetical protein